MNFANFSVTNNIHSDEDILAKTCPTMWYVMNDTIKIPILNTSSNSIIKECKKESYRICVIIMSIITSKQNQMSWPIGHYCLYLDTMQYLAMLLHDM